MYDQSWKNDKKESVNVGFLLKDLVELTFVLFIWERYLKNHLLDKYLYSQSIY